MSSPGGWWGSTEGGAGGGPWSSRGIRRTTACPAPHPRRPALHSSPPTPPPPTPLPRVAGKRVSINTVLRHATITQLCAFLETEPMAAEAAPPPEAFAGITDAPVLSSGQEQMVGGVQAARWPCLLPPRPGCVAGRPSSGRIVTRPPRCLLSRAPPLPLIRPLPRSLLPPSPPLPPQLILHSLDPGSSSYNQPLPLAIHGTVDPARVRAALEGVVARHSVLRTTFRPTTDGGWRPVVHPAGSQAAQLPVRAVDLAADKGVRFVGLLGGWWLSCCVRTSNNSRRCEHACRWGVLWVPARWQLHTPVLSSRLHPPTTSGAHTLLPWLSPPCSPAAGVGL